MSLRHRNGRLSTALLLVSLASTLLLGGCSSSSSSDDDEGTAPLPSPLVIDTAGGEVVGATVFLVPASEVKALAASEITAANILDGSAEGFDEPLEDLIDGINSSSFPQGVTGPGGSFTVNTDDVAAADTHYFLFVLPADDDTRHVEGGRLVLPETHACLQQFSAEFPGGEIRPRRALSADFLLCLLETEDRRGHIELSTRPSSQASYVGSSTCNVCHGTQFTQHAKSLHRLSLQVPGKRLHPWQRTLQDEELIWQDVSEFGATAGDPEGSQYFDKALVERFADGSDAVGGSTICYSDYDGTRGFDKFKTLEATNGCDAGAIASIRVWCENSVAGVCVKAPENDPVGTANDIYRIQINNLANPGDPLSGRIYTVSLTYGGGLYKQHYLTRIDGMESTYILPLQFQHEGDDTSTDRSRTVWSDYHLDLWSNVDAADPVAFDPAGFMLQEPDVTESFDIRCAGCHFTGYRVASTVTGEWTAQAVADPNGPIDFNGDGSKEEINIGCELCHGPGSDHVAAGGEGIAIVSPPNLSPGRANLICGQCHDRRGNGAAVTGDAPLNENNEPAEPGLGRDTFLAEFATVRKGPRLDADSLLPSIDSDFWPDDLHSKSHYPQYADFIKSSLYRNGSWLMACNDCHNPHGPQPGTGSEADASSVEADIRHQLLLSIDDDSLCLSCHSEALGDLPAITDKGDHTRTVTGFNHVGGNQQGQGPGGQPGPGQGNQGQREVPSCANCHMHQIAKSGAGRLGNLLQERGNGGGGPGGGNGGGGGPGDGTGGGAGPGDGTGGDAGPGDGTGGGAGPGDGTGGGAGPGDGTGGGAGPGDGTGGGAAPGDGTGGGAAPGDGTGGGAGPGDGTGGGAAPGDGTGGGAAPGDGTGGGAAPGDGTGGGAAPGDGTGGGAAPGDGTGGGAAPGDGTGGGAAPGDGTGGGAAPGDGTGGGAAPGDGTGGGAAPGDGTGGGAAPGDGTGGGTGQQGQLAALANGPGNQGGGETQQFYENDISAHDFSIPRTSNEGVFRDCGLLSMPIPYTRSCGRCHDLNEITNALPAGELCE